MKVKEIMTGNPCQLRSDATVAEAADLMKSRDVGSIIVTDESGKTCGILTDRDIVIRGLAGHKEDPRNQRIGDLASKQVDFVDADSDVEEAIEHMRNHKIRRLPVMENDQTIGVVSLGDLAVARDRRSVLGEISAAPPNQ